MWKYCNKALLNEFLLIFFFLYTKTVTSVSGIFLIFVSKLVTQHLLTLGISLTAGLYNDQLELLFIPCFVFSSFRLRSSAPGTHCPEKEACLIIPAHFS